MKIFSIKFIIPLILICAFCFNPLAVLAQDASGAPSLSAGVKKFGAAAFGTEEPANLYVIIANIINILLGLLGIVFVILMIFGGYVWMTAMGAEDKIKKAKGIITQAVIGIVIVVMAYGISIFVLNAIYDATTDSAAGGTDTDIMD